MKLRKWLVESEGSLVCFRGPPASQINQRLGELMPAAMDRGGRIAVPRRTDRAPARRCGGCRPRATGRATWPICPRWPPRLGPEAAKALAVVLATGVGGGSGQASPVMVYQPVGNGRVVVVEGAGMWRWAFLAPEHKQAGGNLRLAVAEPGPLAGGQRGHVAFAAAGPASRQTQLQHRRKRHGHAPGPRLVRRCRRR